MTSCQSVKAVCQGKSICLHICLLPPPGRKSLIACVETPLFLFLLRAAVLHFLLVLYGTYYKISRFCNSVAFFCRSGSEMYQNAEKTKIQASTPPSTIFPGVFGRTGISLDVPGF